MRRRGESDPDTGLGHFLVMHSTRALNAGYRIFSGSFRHPRAILVFMTLLLLFAVGMMWSMSTNPAAAVALDLMLRVSIIVTVTYALLCYIFGFKGKKKSNVDQTVRVGIWWAMFSVMVAGAVALVAFVPTTASVELFRLMFTDGYSTQWTDAEIRLSTSFMPIWAQTLFEAARRLAAPYCLIEFFFGPAIVHRRRQIGFALLFIVSLFVFSTLDRAVPVFYFAMIMAGILLTYGLSALKNKYLYLNLIGIVFVIVTFKNIQYGEFHELRFTRNFEIAGRLESKPVTAGKPAATAQESAIVVEPDKPAASAPSQPSYIGYAVSSLIDRILLSPVAMTLYAVESYGPGEYKHWSATRIFSLLGYGRFVGSLETGKKKYHDAFPVTFIGDLWRNGGHLYVPFYAALIALTLFLLDRFVFASQAPLSLQVISLFGVLFLFYGNAFNATSWLMICGSLALIYCMDLLSRWLRASGHTPHKS